MLFYSFLREKFLNLLRGLEAAISVGRVSESKVNRACLLQILLDSILNLGLSHIDPIVQSINVALPLRGEKV